MKLKSRLAFSVAIVVIFFLVAVLSTLAVPAPPANAQGPRGQIVGRPVQAAKTGVVNFSQIAKRGTTSPSRAPSRRRVIPPPRNPAQRSSQPNNSILRGSVPSSAPAQSPLRVLAASPSPSASFAGLADDGTIIPPDTTGAVGLNYLMETLNNNIGIFDRSGNLLSQVVLFDFWNASPSVLPPGIDINSGPFDPSVIYDPFDNRWIHVVLSNQASAQSSLCVAVSQTSDPTGNWNRFCFDVDNTDTLYGDFPRLGFNKDWIVVTINMYPISSGTSRGQVFAFNKANLYSNTNSGNFVFTVASDNSTSIPFTMVPAVTLDNTLDTVYLVRQTDCSTSCSTIAKSSLVGAPPAAPVLSIDTAVVTSTLSSWYAYGGDFLPQAGGTRGIAVNSDDILNVMARTVGGVTSIWCTQTILLPDTTPTHAAAQWWQLDATASSSTIIQQGRVEDPTATQTNGGYHYAYPSIAVNKYGDMLLGYSRFSSNTYASAAYSFRYAGDALGTTRDDVTLNAGLDYYDQDYGYGSNRWGDFSNTVVDPANDVDMWTVQEYAKNSVNGEGRWGTWWGKLGVANTTTAITAHVPNPSFVDDPINVNVAVTVVPPSSGTPTGSATVSDGTTQCSIVLPATSCRLTFTSIGTKHLTAIYSGDSSFDGSGSDAVLHSVLYGWYFPIIGKDFQISP